MADPLPPIPDDTRMPRWVKLSLLAAGLFVVLLAIMLMLGHGPAQHGGHRPTPSAAAPQ